MSNKKRGATTSDAVDGAWPLPRGWQWLAAKSVLPLQYGKALTANQRTDGSIEVFGSAGVIGFHGQALCSEPAIIVGRKGSAGSTYYTEKPSFTIDTAYYCPESASSIDLRYGYYFLDYAKLGKLDQSTAVPSLSRDVYDLIPIPVPDRPTQQAIARRVDDLFSEIDDGEAALARARADLEVYRRALLKAAVTGELTADWRAANPPQETGAQLLARILATRRTRWQTDPKNKGKKYAAPIAPIVSDLPRLPSEWIWASLDQLCFHITSGSRAWSPYYGLGSAVFVMAQNVRRGYYDKRFAQLVGPPANDPERARTRISKADLLLTIVGANTGDLCKVDFDPEEYYVCQSVALLRPELKELASFIEAFFSNEFGRKLQMEKLIYGAGRPHLSFDQIRSMAVPLCPILEMDQVERHTLETERVVKPASKILEPSSIGTAELRQSILSAAFRGELL